MSDSIYRPTPREKRLADAMPLHEHLAQAERLRQLLRRVLEQHPEPCEMENGVCLEHECSEPCVYGDIRKEMDG